MQIRYKLLAPQRTSYNGMQWIQGVPQEITIPGNALCSKGVFHSYASPVQAILFNPIFESCAAKAGIFYTPKSKI